MEDASLLQHCAFLYAIERRVLNCGSTAAAAAAGAATQHAHRVSARRACRSAVERPHAGGGWGVGGAAKVPGSAFTFPISSLQSCHAPTHAPHAPALSLATCRLHPPPDPHLPNALSSSRSSSFFPSPLLSGAVLSWAVAAMAGSLPRLLLAANARPKAFAPDQLCINCCIVCVKGEWLSSVWMPQCHPLLLAMLQGAVMALTAPPRARTPRTRVTGRLAPPRALPAVAAGAGGM
jgi:hypothetical protein